MRALLVLSVAISLFFVSPVRGVSHKFIGGFLPAPPHYVVASLADIVGDEFVAQYNDIGLPFLQSFTHGYIDCFFQVQEGYLTYGFEPLPQSSMLGPFESNASVCKRGVTPTNSTFGVFTGTYKSLWLESLDAAALAMLGANSTWSSAPENWTVQQTFVLKWKEPYVVALYGAHFAAPAGYRRMSLADFRSDAFVEYYNKFGVRFIGNATSRNYCCMVQLQDDGWVQHGMANTGYSPLTTSVDGLWNCGNSAMGQVVLLTTGLGGPHSIVFATLNLTDMARMTEYYGYDGCNQFTDSLNMFMLDERYRRG